MISSLARLAYDGQAELEDPARIGRLYRHKHLGNAVRSVLGLAGLAAAAYGIAVTPGALSDWAWWVKGGALFLSYWIASACVILLAEARADRLRLYRRVADALPG